MQSTMHPRANARATILIFFKKEIPFSGLKNVHAEKQKRGVENMRCKYSHIQRHNCVLVHRCSNYKRPNDQPRPKVPNFFQGEIKQQAA